MSERWNKSKAKWQVPIRLVDGSYRCCLEGEAKEMFIKLFPKKRNTELAVLFGISLPMITKFRNRLGLTKDKKSVYKHAEQTKRKRGVYDNRKMPDGLKRALERMFAEGFSTMRRLKEISPRRYERARKKMSKTRKELYRKERLRVEYGLKQKTNVRLSNMTKQSYWRKYRMISEFNYFSDPNDVRVVCYDGETRRDAASEEKAVKCGLKIVDCE